MRLAVALIELAVLAPGRRRDRSGGDVPDVSYDGARRWKRFDGAAYDAVDCVRHTCWASGPAGAVAVLK